MDTTAAGAEFYLPSASEQEGAWQPLATALPLEPGKRMCEQHFLKRCRALLLRLPLEQQKQVPAGMLETFSLKWTVATSGEQEGHLTTKLPTALEALAQMTYKLRPVP